MNGHTSSHGTFIKVKRKLLSKQQQLMSFCFAEGVKDKDKALLMATLANIATVRDNTYHLMRHVWNDVQEDWPFYTEQDRQMLKR